MILLEGKPSVHNLRIWDQTCLKYSKFKKKNILISFSFISATGATRSQRFQKAFKDWICGTTEKPKQMTEFDIIQLRHKLTSIDEKPFYRNLLNGIAVLMSLLTAFLIGCFH